MTEAVNINQLKTIIQRLDAVEREKQDAVDAIKDIYAEAKGNGYDVKALRKVMSLRKLSEDERTRMEAMVDTYMGALS